MLKNCKNIVLFILVCYFFKFSKNRSSTPSIPCPNIFNYILNSETNQIEGQITILNGFQDHSDNILHVLLTYPSDVKYVGDGSIKLFKNKNDTLDDIEQYKSVLYTINFPVRNPLPTLQEIVFNGIKICRNSKYKSGSIKYTFDFNLRIKNTYRISTTETPYFNLNTPSSKRKFKISKIDNSCGNSVTLLNLISGGNILQPNAWPWLVAIFEDFVYLCGGSIIAPNVILTAAHCVIMDYRIRQPQIALGMFDIRKFNDPNILMANAHKIIPHPSYNDINPYDNDIAIIILDRSYRYNNRIRPICMWPDKSDINEYTNEDGQVAGWGNADRIPRIVGSKIASRDSCRNSNLGEYITGRNFCAGNLNEEGPCKGDSGSGFMIEKNNKWFLRGIVSGAVSHVKKVCNLKEYVIYTDVTKFLEWINSEM